MNDLNYAIECLKLKNEKYTTHEWLKINANLLPSVSSTKIALKCFDLEHTHLFKSEMLIEWLEICKMFNIDFSDLFHDNQTKSKKWLTDKLKKYILKTHKNNIFIFGGWYGILAYMLQHDTDITTKYIYNIDKNQALYEPARRFNNKSMYYQHIIADMIDYEYPFRPNIVINTSCEHLSRDEFLAWYKKIPDAVTVVLQTNNYDKIQEHVGCFENLNTFSHFIRESLKVGGDNIYYTGKLEMSNFERYMVIFKKPSDVVL